MSWELHTYGKMARGQSGIKYSGRGFYLTRAFIGDNDLLGKNIQFYKDDTTRSYAFKVVEGGDDARKVNKNGKIVSKSLTEALKEFGYPEDKLIEVKKDGEMFVLLKNITPIPVQ